MLLKLLNLNETDVLRKQLAEALIDRADTAAKAEFYAAMTAMLEARITRLQREIAEKIDERS